HRRMRRQLLQLTVGQFEHLPVDQIELPAPRELLELRRQRGTRDEGHDDPRRQPRISVAGPVRQLAIELVALRCRTRHPGVLPWSVALMCLGGGRMRRQACDEDGENRERSLRSPYGFPSFRNVPVEVHRAEWQSKDSAKLSYNGV